MSGGCVMHVILRMCQRLTLKKFGKQDKKMSDDYKPEETREQYVVRRYLENAYAKQIMGGWKPTQFVQHYNPKKNPNPRWKLR
jgi:hypothetical protein